MVTGRTLHQERDRLLLRTGQNTRNTAPYRLGTHDDRHLPQQRLPQYFLQLVEGANSVGDIYVITDILPSHNSVSTWTWLEDHHRLRHVFIPVGACWLNVQEGWWRIFRKTALP
ncbi:transposase [Streptomyces sp. 1222.5]|uniref:transposase n=1 Tax=Streptomyces sp. 1222.5 TaxID=1881026 RepID=UPI003EBA695A